MCGEGNQVTEGVFTRFAYYLHQLVGYRVEAIHLTSVGAAEDEDEFEDRAGGGTGLSVEL